MTTDTIGLIPQPLPRRPGGRSSWQVFQASLRAFLLRDMHDHFGRYRLGYLWAFVEPAATVTVLTLIHAGARGGNTPIYGESPVIFFVLGAVPFFMFFNCVNRATGAIEGNRGLFSYRQIKPIDVLIARGLIEAVTMLNVGLVFILGWQWFGGELNIQDPLLLIAAMGSLFLLGLGLGLVFEVFGTVHPDLRRLFSIVMRPMFFVSGLFFTIEMIPVDYRIFLVWNPILHAVDFARDAILVGYDSPASGTYLAGSILVLFFVGLASYRRYLFRLV